jgi:hypothetical protein
MFHAALLQLMLVAAPNPDHVYHQPEAQRLHSHQRARRPAEYPIWCKRQKRGIFPANSPFAEANSDAEHG